MSFSPHLLAEDIDNSGLADYRANLAGGNVFINVVPPTPDYAVSIMDFGGEYLSVIDEMITVFQVRVRGGEMEGSSARTVAAALSERWRSMGWGLPFTMGASRVVWIEPEPVYLLGFDEHNRPEYAFRVRVRHTI